MKCIVMGIESETLTFSLVIAPFVLDDDLYHHLDVNTYHGIVTEAVLVDTVNGLSISATSHIDQWTSSSLKDRNMRTVYMWRMKNWTTSL